MEYQRKKKRKEDISASDHEEEVGILMSYKYFIIVQIIQLVWQADVQDKHNRLSIGIPVSKKGQR